MSSNGAGENLEFGGLAGKHLHFDCVSGMAGDMCIGALIDVGVPAQVIRAALGAVGLGEDRLQVESVVKSGIASTNVWVRCEEGQIKSHGHGHEHSQGHSHEHHHYSDIRRRVEEAHLSPEVIALSLRIFDRIAVAEGKMHGVATEDVAFHEVGAIDSIADVIGSAAAIDWLAPASISCSPVAMGKGSVQCAHGILPVPSPAALEILRLAKAAVSDGNIAVELCTPTGAAILAEVVTQWSGMPEMITEAIGYGAGDLTLPDRPNVVRVIVGTPTSSPGKSQAGGDLVIDIESNIDDMSPELCEHVTECLFATGALDVWWTSIAMKKGRPALALRLLCPLQAKEQVVACLFRETSSIGLRFKQVQRLILPRQVMEVETEHGLIAVKIAYYDGRVVNIAPEYEACRERALAAGVPLKQVFADALASASQQVPSKA